LSKHFAGR